MPEINITDPASILSAIPAVLGFTPHASIIALLIRTDNGAESLHGALRIDIDAYAARRLTIETAPAFRNITSVVLVAVCAPNAVDHAIAVLDILRAGFAAMSISVPIRLTAAALDTPAQWTDVDRGTTGQVIPFSDTVIAADTVLSGRRIAASRADIVAEFAQAATTLEPVDAEPVAIIVDTFEAVAAIISGTERADQHPDLAASVAVLVTDLTQRDTALLLSMDHPEPAAELWRHLASQLCGAARVATLTMAAGCYYAAGDAVRAGIALDIAADDAVARQLPYPKLAHLLLAALQSGMPPADIRTALAALGHRDA